MDYTKAFRTYPNGCNFRLRVEANQTTWIEFGCYCLINLAQGDAGQLVEALESAPGGRIPLPPGDARYTLLERKPCQRCGGPVFET